MHGNPLGADEIAAARETLGWEALPFEVPEGILADWRTTGERGKGARAEWEQRGQHFERQFRGAAGGDFLVAFEP